MTYEQTYEIVNNHFYNWIELGEGSSAALRDYRQIREAFIISGLPTKHLRTVVRDTLLEANGYDWRKFR